jgi:hypothetical protein
MKFALEYLKSLNRKPRVHPNGFIQFDVEPNIMRLNVWPADPIPGHPGRIHPIHNHSFDIGSTVICGALTNDTYYFEKSTSYVTHVLHEARRVSENDSVLSPVDGTSTGFVGRMSSHTYKAGQRYTLNREILHDSIPNGLTATLMTLEKPGRYAPKVAIPVMVAPMNGYLRDAFDEGMLWDIITQVL